MSYRQLELFPPPPSPYAARCQARRSFAWLVLFVIGSACCCRGVVTPHGNVVWWKGGA